MSSATEPIATTAPAPSRSESRFKSWPVILAFGMAAAILVILGYWRMFTQFMSYDDEGHFLWSLRGYCEGGGLYDRVTSLYGPFFFTFYDWLHRLTGLSFDHDTGRLITLASWCGTALLCGIVAWKLTRNVAAGLSAMALSFVCLISVIREPMHPSVLLTPAAALGALLGVVAIMRHQTQRFALGMGAIGTVMALTKVNVGGLFLIAACSWIAMNARAERQSRALALLTALGAVLLPLWLMRSQWPHPWVTTYTLVFSCGAIVMVAAIHRGREAEHGVRSMAFFLLGAAIVAAVIIAAASARGARWDRLFAGVIATPQKFSQSNYLPLGWLPGARELAIIQMILAAWFYFWRGGAQSAWILVGIRLAVCGWFVARIPLLFSDATSLQDFCFQYGPSVAWLMMVPLSETKSRWAQARMWVAWVFVWQTVQAYPVAGSQIGWGSFLWPVLFAVGLHEALIFAATKVRIAAGFRRAITVVMFLLPAVVAVWAVGRVGYENFTSRESLRLAGATRLHLREDYTSQLRILVKNIHAHAGLLASYPDMFSFNVWTGKRSADFTGVQPEAREQAVVQQLRDDPRAVVIVNQARLDLLVAQGFAAPRETFFYRSLSEMFIPAFRVDSYEFWVHRDRKIASFCLARLTAAQSPMGPKLTFTLDALPRAVAVMEFRLLDAAPRTIGRLPLNAEQQWRITPLDLEGEPSGDSVAGRGPFRVSVTARVELELPPLDDTLPVKRCEIRLLDADNRLLDALRFDP